MWAIVRTLSEERKKREVEPTLTMLRKLLMQQPGSTEEEHAQQRMRQMHQVIEQLTHWYDEVEKLETERLEQLLGLGAKVVKLLEMKDRLAVLSSGCGARMDAARDREG